MQRKMKVISRFMGFGVLWLVSAFTFAQDGKMYPMDAPEEPRAIPLNTGGVEGQKEEESWFRQWGDPMARNITKATLTPFLADPEKANGTTVIVAPGGGFMWLSMDNEGWQVAEALAAQGINAFVLKYRLQPTAAKLEDFEDQLNQRFADAENMARESEDPQPRPRWDLSNQLEDVEAAYALIKSRADEWNVDVDNIGMVGFSAGAGLTMATTLQSEKVDLAFIAPIYGGMNRVDVPKNAPPMFAVIAVDDFLFTGDFGLLKSWYEADIPFEFHLYQNGGHGFGLGNPDRTSNKWFDAFMHWLDVNGFVNP
ncbi:alpha/beta hydrolase [Marinimicrobium sp. ABcell2]|uniref:alpha/beta hydrolase n=1 Tax=Marinimicrobium sp. ABcell2 TaxID=3069751 RepID=UPI0027B09DAB|nr:alpha/beta hydrolase [Marinimicrobium sp. ABcell2]MDQ2076933.1 alpha/beta hydrolase [Marinimicrobium sp. ABcell2]